MKECERCLTIEKDRYAGIIGRETDCFLSWRNYNPKNKREVGRLFGCVVVLP